MPDQDEKLREVIAYIKSGEEEKAGHLFLRVLKKDVIDYMMYKYGWEEDEAVFLLNDAYLLIQEKIKNSTLLTFNKSYVIGVCIRLGSKAYHRVKKNKEQFDIFLKESVQKLADQKFAYAQIELYEESYTLNEQKALLAFQQLDDKCQELVELRYIKNLGHEEISQRVSGIKNREVSRTLVSRCLKKLEHIIKKTKH